MAAYARETCRQLQLRKLDFIAEVDIKYSIGHLLNTRRLTKEHVIIAWKYLAGYSVEELSEIYSNPVDMLIEFFFVLEAEIGYTDEQVIRPGFIQQPVYQQFPHVFRERMYEFGRVFE